MCVVAQHTQQADARLAGRQAAASARESARACERERKASRDMNTRRTRGQRERSGALWKTVKRQPVKRQPSPRYTPAVTISRTQNGMPRTCPLTSSPIRVERVTDIPFPPPATVSSTNSITTTCGSRFSCRPCCSHCTRVPEAWPKAVQEMRTFSNISALVNFIYKVTILRTFENVRNAIDEMARGSTP